MSKMTAYSRTDKRLRLMTAEEAEKAAWSDPDAQPLSPADLRGMKRVPQVEGDSPGAGIDAGRVCGAISHSYWHAA